MTISRQSSDNYASFQLYQTNLVNQLFTANWRFPCAQSESFFKIEKVQYNQLSLTKQFEKHLN